MKKTADDLSDLRKRVREIQQSKTMSPEKKAALIKQIETREINLARMVMGKQGTVD